MIHEEFDHDSDTDHEAVVIRSEKILRKVERDIQRKQYRKRTSIVPGHAEMHPLPPLEPLPPNEAPVVPVAPLAGIPEPPEAPEVPMPEIWAAQEPSEPEVIIEPEFDIDFEADPMPEPEPDIPLYRF